MHQQLLLSHRFLRRRLRGRDALWLALLHVPRVSRQLELLVLHMHLLGKLMVRLHGGGEEPLSAATAANHTPTSPPCLQQNCAEVKRVLH